MIVATAEASRILNMWSGFRRFLLQVRTNMNATNRKEQNDNEKDIDNNGISSDFFNY